MTQLFQPFNPQDYNPTQGPGQMPVGRHPVVIKECELKETKDKDGGFLEFYLEIIDGPQKGTGGAYRLNLYNKSEKAKNIAHSQLSALCHVTKQFQLGSDGMQLGVLFNIPFQVEVALQGGDNPSGYTEIKKVFDALGNEPGKAPTNTGAAQVQQGNSGQSNWGGGQQNNATQNNSQPANGAGANTGGAANWSGNQSQPAQQNEQPAQSNSGGASAGGRPSWAS